MYRDCQAHFSVPVVRVKRQGRETEYLWVLACQRPKGHAGAHASFASRKP